MKKLIDLAEKEYYYCTDKQSVHKYIPVYEKYLEK